MYAVHLRDEGKVLVTHSSFLHFVKSRVESGERQTRLAQRLGVTPALVGHWLRGRRSPRASVLRLAEYVARYEPIGCEISDIDAAELSD